ncbi:MAG: response regulator transcription factor [Planctomycetota bacterium]
MLRNETIRVLIVEDHPLVRLGLATALAKDPELQLCGEADCESGALEIAEREHPHVAIVDMRLRSGHGLSLISRLAAKEPGPRVVVSSMYEPELYAKRAMKAGAVAYVPKYQSIDDLLAQVKQVAKAPRRIELAETEESIDTVIDPLSDRELEVFQLIGEGFSTREIADRLHRSVKTIETHKGRIKSKLELPSASALAREATRWTCRPAA